MTKSKSASLTD